ncbi:unnamed protein product [Lupinus luteus]|uniref:Uncharacterized protein n=1 Tax=Lupinus luteus TaxID=3873 RepID=A0AAV1VVS1_LUPLU
MHRNVQQMERKAKPRSVVEPTMLRTEGPHIEHHEVQVEVPVEVHDDLIINLKIDNREVQQIPNLERVPSSPVLVEGEVEESPKDESVGTRVEESIEPDLNIVQQMQVESFEIQPNDAMPRTAAKESKLVGRLWSDDSDEIANELEGIESTYTKVLSKSQKKKLRQKQSQERVHFTVGVGI